MNSLRSVSEANLVNFSADLTKDTLLSFPFDHLYACHAESPVRQTLHLDKEVEISTHCVVTADKDLVVDNSAEIARLTKCLSNSENQNKKLKDLLIYHLDLIQQQNDLISKREKSHQALRQENDTLKSKLTRLDKRLTVTQRHPLTATPLLHLPPPSPVPVTSTVVQGETPQQISLNTFTELLLPAPRTSPFFTINSDINKPKTFEQDSLELNRSTETTRPALVAAEVTILNTNTLNSSNYTMIDNKRSLVRKETKTEKRSEPLYTINPTSGNPVIQRLQRKRRSSTGIGTLSGMTKSAGTNKETSDNSKSLEDDFNVNKKPKMINTYGKPKSSGLKKTNHFGSLSDRLQLIDTTPTGEDPYQIGEAEMREQSPIPKLMLQKTNHGRMRICSDTTSKSTVTSRTMYDSPNSEGRTKASKTTNKSNKYNYSSGTYVSPIEIKQDPSRTLLVDETGLNFVKTEPEMDWRIYDTSAKPKTETSLCDFSYGETSTNLASNILPLPSLDSVDFQDLFGVDATLSFEPFDTMDYSLLPDKTLTPPDPENSLKKRGARTPSLRISDTMESDDSPHGGKPKSQKRGRKRALSTTGHGRTKIPRKSSPKPRASRKAVSRGKKSPVPAIVTHKPYHTLMGDPDLSWHYGLDPDVKIDDIKETTQKAPVEVPMWRVKHTTVKVTHGREVIENLDDKTYEKRHQKFEAEEKRQLRWHMRRIREQKHVERLRQRQKDKDSWSSASPQQPSVYTVWPNPQRDLFHIEINKTLPVAAFGEEIPAIPEGESVPPWIRSTRSLKRSKRFKTLH